MADYQFLRPFVWGKGHVIAGYDASVWQHDDYGTVMRYDDYGDRTSEFGWELDHIVRLPRTERTFSPITGP